ncbi:MAG: right-handed parallel beta-helix repeat-containing protein, partial [Thermoplasmata archaeon]|nr:right-handed parallel beta-helix repeat-containing protein [Thermoplasmata archaeon]
TIESSTPGQNGIEVQADSIDVGSLELSEMTIKAENAASGWYFTINGSANLHDGVKLLNVQDGVQIFSSSVTLDDVEVLAQGMYGVYVSNCDPTIINCDISNENEVEGSWDGRYSRPGKAWGLWVSGTSAALAEPTLENLNIHVKIVDTWNHDTTSSSVYEQMYAYGLYANYVDLGVLTDITITFELGVKATIKYTGSTIYLRPYMYVYGLQLAGATVLDGFDNVIIDTSKYYVEGDAIGPTNGYFYNYWYFYGLYNSVSNPGSVPGTISGLTIRGHHMTYALNAPFTTAYEYVYGRAIYWMPSSTPPPGGYIFDGIVLEDVGIERIFEIRNSWDFTMRECLIKDCGIGSKNRGGSILYLQSWRYEITIENNTIAGNNAPYSSSYLFRYYYVYADVTMVGNNITDNTFGYFGYIYRLQTGIMFTFEDNNYTDNTNLAYMFYLYYTYGTVSVINNTFANNQHNSYWMYNYYLYGTFTLKDNEITGNTHNSYFIYAYYPRGPFTMTGNNIRGNQWNSYFVYLYSNYQDVTITNNEFTENTGNSWWIYINYARGPVLIEDNRVVNNKLGGGLYLYNNNWLIRLKNNLFEDNRITTASYQLLYVYYNSRDYEITGNSILNNTLTTSAFRFYYIGNYGVRAITMTSNVFLGNKGDTENINLGLVQFEYLRQDMTVRENYFEGNDANCIVNYRPYPNYAYTFTVESNEFVNNSGKSIVYSEIDNMNVRVRSNTGTGNDDYCLYLEQVSTTINGPNMVEVEMNN